MECHRPLLLTMMFSKTEKERVSKSEDYEFSLLSQAGLRDIKCSHYVTCILTLLMVITDSTKTLIYEDGPTHYAVGMVGFI